MWRLPITAGAELPVDVQRVVFSLLEREKKRMGRKLVLKTVEKHLRGSASAGGASSPFERPAGFSVPSQTIRLPGFVSRPTEREM